ncbi:hypothetical protein HGG65_08870 [Alteromonadaceae bacterium A_SAG4]|nr:hypothetical protein [Alteromonadaceae bacterium A_SAG4]NKX19316.1 hypothetical protein [Alteromonadaceae bacterium A_SAG8]NKX33433.1 hypothetical protein [Alteromonadaceae bacterium A_SAG3]
MKDSKHSIVRKYVRQSRSPFVGDDSTILLLATVTEDNDQIAVSYDRYIYLHRDQVGRWLGISISKAVEAELTDGGGKYRENASALKVLLHYHSHIKTFLSYFSDEIEAIFGLDSETWLYACKARWKKLTQ